MLKPPNASDRSCSARQAKIGICTHLNSALNGVWLRQNPLVRGVSRVHETLHTAGYYATVEARLVRAASGGNAGLVQELKAIASELAAGTFKVQ